MCPAAEEPVNSNKIGKMFARSRIRSVRAQDMTPVVGHVGLGFDKLMLVWGGYWLKKAQVPISEVYRDPALLYVYHTEFDKWISFRTEGEIPPRSSGCCGVICGFKMYIFGGYLLEDADSSTLYSLDLCSMVWKKITPKSKKRPTGRHKLVAWEYRKKLYFFGGFGSPYRRVQEQNQNAEVEYLHAFGNFCPDDSMNYTVAWNNQLVVFDLETNTWSNPECTGDIPTPRAAHSATKLDYHRVLIFGGRHEANRMNDLYVLNLQSMIWTEIVINGIVPQGRSWHCMAQIDPSKLMMYGGFSQDNRALRDCWTLDTENWQWKSHREYESGKRLWHSGVGIEGSLYIYGGCSSNLLNPVGAKHYHNDLIVLGKSPKSLVFLAATVITENSKRCQKDMMVLPNHLHRKIIFLRQKNFKPADIGSVRDVMLI